MKLNIRKIQLFALLFLGLSVAAHAQSRWSAGPKVGVNQATFTNDDTKSWNTGFNGGLFLTYSDIHHLGITGELLYVTKGAEVETGQQDVQINLGYLEAPLLFRYFFGQGGFRPNLFAGPYAAYNLSAKRIDQRTDAETNLEDRVEPLDLGFLVGGGANIRVMDHRWINVDVRYNQGITRVLSDVPDVRNGAFTLNVGYAFGL
ncbi:Opacity protein [Catalinimonas alkaloidigena]|uniref:Opacity protein n=1 Tax=Catalinimonas alkaloidigena TaxID=1075417 RepID=A0A1G9GXZ7_9BACT|nr:porin family protein [Catalinimonas alkaloidigena]SDL05465.1 Opacity protein [Catalinimonas alkaloidigena]